MKQMVEVFESYGGPVIAVQKVPREEISAYGVIDGTPEGDSGRLYRIRDMVEKPNVGRGAERPRDHRPVHPDPRHLRGAREHAARRGRRDPAHGRPARGSRRAAPLYGYQFEGTRHDAGNKLGFLKATVEFALSATTSAGRSGST